MKCMVPPWVTFCSIEGYDGDFANGSETDVAGFGVVFSFAIASIMATSASVLAVLLDEAFDSKCKLRFHGPIRYPREHFINTEWKKDYKAMEVSNLFIFS